MNIIPANVRKHLAILIPASVFKEVICFTFYDNHPQDSKTIDIIICTRLGEIQEIYNRKTVSSHLLDGIKATEIRIFRNRICDLFYLVLTEDELIVISRKEQIEVLRRVNNVARYEICDEDCEGRAFVKIFLKDDAIPLIFDDNFQIQEKDFSSSPVIQNDTIPLIMNLKRKLTEAKYCVKLNENKYDEYMKLSQRAAYNIYLQAPTSEDILLKNLQELSTTLQIQTGTPQVKFCNKKVVIILNITNQNSLSIENVCVVLHTTSKKSLNYSTKFYKEVPSLPYWKEIKSQKVKANGEISIVIVIDHEELQNSIPCDAEFDVLLSYQKGGKSYLLPFEKVKQSSLDYSGNVDAVSSQEYDSRTLLLCILSTYESTKLHLRPLTDSKCISPAELFGDYLKLCSLPGFNDVLIHKLCPDHVLYGVLIMHTLISSRIIEVQIFTRFQFQILALINSINDIVPQRLVITPENCEIVSLTNTLEFDTISEETKSDKNLVNLSKTILKQTQKIKEYLDNCMIKMNESKDALVKEKLGFQIDITAQGLSKYLDFRNEMLQEMQRTLDEVDEEEDSNDVEYMVIDD